MLQLTKEKNQTIVIDYLKLVEINEELAKTITDQYYRLDPYLHNALNDFLETSLTENINNIAISFKGFPAFIPLRKLNSSQLGRMTKFSATVTRCSQVKPELIEAKFKCNECGCIYEDLVKQQFKYTEPSMCQTNMCSNKSNWTMISKESKFLDWQCIRAQENSTEIPSGSMPRTMEIILRGNLVEKAKPGDNIFITGCLIVIPDLFQLRSVSGAGVQVEKESSGSGNAFSQSIGFTGLKALGPRDLTYRVSYLANHVNVRNCSEVEDISEMTSSSVIAKELAPLMPLINNPQTLYRKLVNSISPSVFGHENIKKGILLQLLSGVQKTTNEGIRLRGDINICIVGDPSTSKSQFLKYVTHYFPRSVYTSGKASSAAGLTASVVRDEDSGEYTIEAGALMLADQGICAIDEFDKMNLYDQVAIHEAMEQQTISIAKAGVHATLNARASILAAANPINGRYNKKLSLRVNKANLAKLLDEPDLLKDTKLASHIVDSHGKEQGQSGDNNEDIIELELLRKFIMFARTIKPMLTPEAKKMLADCYRILRLQDMQGVSKNSYRITVRQLESMIRLSEAIAKAHLDEKLLKQSIVLVEQDSVECFLEEPIPEEANTQPITDENTQVRSEPTATQSSTTKSIKLDREKYESMKRMIMLKLNSVEESEADAMKFEDLVQWYLEQKENDIDTEQQLEEETKIIKTVINYMIKKDNVLISLKENYTQEDQTQSSVSSETNPIILVHPNYQP